MNVSNTWQQARKVLQTSGVLPQNNTDLYFKRQISYRPGEWREWARSSCWRGWHERTRRVQGVHATWPRPTCAHRADVQPPWYALDSVGCSHSADLGTCPLSSPVEFRTVVIDHQNFNLVPTRTKQNISCLFWISEILFVRIRWFFI